ncbi:hypothetical protein SVIOM342S_09532 [Streptomyces violaceorubidus]
MVLPIFIEPPKTYVKRTTNITGWMTPNRTISGIRVIRMRFLRAMTSESRTDWPMALVGAVTGAASVAALTWRPLLLLVAGVVRRAVRLVRHLRPRGR